MVQAIYRGMRIMVKLKKGTRVRIVKDRPGLFNYAVGTIVLAEVAHGIVFYDVQLDTPVYVERISDYLDTFTVRAAEVQPVE